MSNLLDSILETWLPSKWPRLIMGSSISLSAGILFPQEWLQKIGFGLTEQEMSAARIVGIPWLLLFALALSHFLIVRELKSSSINKCKGLEQKLIARENWDTEAAKYELLEVSFGVRVYSEKSQIQRIYDRIWLCPNCFESKQKQVLQLQHRKMPWEYICNHCKSSFMVRPIKDEEQA
jgi:hypothetical protein